MTPLRCERLSTPKAVAATVITYVLESFAAALGIGRLLAHTRYLTALSLSPTPRSSTRLMIKSANYDPRPLTRVFRPESTLVPLQPYRECPGARVKPASRCGRSLAHHRRCAYVSDPLQGRRRNRQKSSPTFCRIIITSSAANWSLVDWTTAFSAVSLDGIPDRWVCDPGQHAT